MKKCLLFIYNPVSGKGKAGTELDTIIHILSDMGYLVTAYPTQGKGDASHIIQMIGMQFDRIVCAGGDGTLSECVSGLMMLKTRPAIGYIPMGSTNDCAKNLQLPKEIKNAVEVAGKGILQPWDIGVLNGRSFVYIAAFGAFTEVTYETPQGLKNIFGHLAYIASGIMSIPTITPYYLEVEYDGGILKGEFFYGMVCNTRSIGGMITLADRSVSMSDGLFEVVLVKNPVNIVDLLRGIQNLLFRKTLDDSCMLVSFKTSRLKILSQTPVTWTLDGEYGGSYNINIIENKHKAVTMVQGSDNLGF